MNGRFIIGAGALAAALGPMVCASAETLGTTTQGSLLYFPKIELRWSDDYELEQDTFIELANDSPDDVIVHFVFVHGDPELAPHPPEPAHPGWLPFDFDVVITGHQPFAWSAATGSVMPSLPPFTYVDPGFPPGRPDPEGGGDRVLRGFLIAFAVDEDGAQIRFDHLTGRGTIVHYDRPAAWSYNAVHAPVVDPGIAPGEPVGTPGVVNLDGIDFAAPPEQLIFNFLADDSPGYGVPPRSDLTLLAASVDVRHGETPVEVRADFEVWNENGLKFATPARCVAGWDERLLSWGGSPHVFHYDTLQTHAGRARVTGSAETGCGGVHDDTALLGLVARELTFDGAGRAAAGFPAVGIGAAPATVLYDAIGPPPEQPARSATPAQPTNSATNPAMDAMMAGSLFIIPDVEVSWTSSGTPVQDTFVHLGNDAPDAVLVQLFLVQGDEPLAADGGERAHLGWNALPSQLELGPHRPAWWSVRQGFEDESLGRMPSWSLLDPGAPSGRPDPVGAGGRVLRGWLVGWAVDREGAPIRWNHLHADALVLHTGDQRAWGVSAYHAQALGSGADGAPIGPPTPLPLDGTVYGAPPDHTLAPFVAVDSSYHAFGSRLYEAEFDLAFLTPAQHLGLPFPPTVEVRHRVWNEYELHFSGSYRCVDGWNRARAGDYGFPNYFLLPHLQTDIGAVQTDGLTSELCAGSQAAAIIGVLETHLIEDGDIAASGATPLVGTGVEPAMVGRFPPRGDFNLDAVNPTPPASYGGAALAPFFWDGLGVPSVGVPIRLGSFDAGTVSDAVLIVEHPSLAFALDNPQTVGGDDLLLDDGIRSINSVSPLHLLLHGLANGRYDVYTYAWHPTSAAITTNVSVDESTEPAQEIGGTWPGAPVLGITHARHRAIVETGTMRIRLTGNAGVAVFNGLQLVRHPPCPADADGSAAVDFNDLLAVLANWGPCDGCPQDIDGDGTVGFNDLLAVLAGWGPCPE